MEARATPSSHPQLLGSLVPVLQPTYKPRGLWEGTGHPEQILVCQVHPLGSAEPLKGLMSDPTGSEAGESMATAASTLRAVAHGVREQRPRSSYHRFIEGNRVPGCSLALSSGRLGNPRLAAA